MRPPPRRERRAEWRHRNAHNGLDIHPGLGGPKVTWAASGLRLPILHPLQAHALARHGSIGGPKTVAVQVGFNRAQRRALWAKKGPAAMTTRGRKRANCVVDLPLASGSGVKGGRWRNPSRFWERPTSTPAESFLPGKGAWNKFALRVEFQRRIAALQERQRRHNAWYRKAGRVAAAWWWFLKFTVRFAWASLKKRVSR